MELHLSTEYIVAIISLAGVILSAIVAYFTSINTQKNSYRNEYYKTIIQKRLDAYNFIDTQLMVMRVTMYDNDDGKYYHMFFDNEGTKYFEYQNNLTQATIRSIWISADMLDAIIALSRIFYEISDKITDDKDDNIKVGKAYYDRLRNAQIKVSKALVTDIADLYDVDSFIKRKKDAYNKRSK